MNVIIEYNFINPKSVEIDNIINNTIKDYIKKYDNSFWKRIEYKYNIRFFDKIKNKMKNISSSHGPKRTIVASNGRYEYIEINVFKILIEGIIKKNVIDTYMKCYILPLLWQKIFTKVANNRDSINNYCNRVNKIDKHLREWYKSNNPNDNEVRAIDG